jgi:hypothetical protein
MAVASMIQGDQYFNGNVGMKTLSPPAGCITNAAIEALAGIDATKVDHQHRMVYSQPNTTATSETRMLFVCYGATGTVIAFRAGSIVAALTTATVTLDLKKNGTSILTGVITLDNANTARVVEAATISSASLVTGDVLEVVITATAGGGTLPTGVFCSLTVNEEAQ